MDETGTGTAMIRDVARSAPRFEPASYGTEAAASRLQELTGVERRTALAMLTIAASEIGEYVINDVRVRGDDNEQEFVIEPF